MVQVRIPATSANLGPGFDCLGMALSLYNTITAEVDKPFQITLKGHYSTGLPIDESNLVWQTMCKLWHKIGFRIPNLSLILENNIPPARGLGSSSAAIVGGLTLANYIAGNPFSPDELLQMANLIEGHPDNVTPALLGGITLSVPTETEVIYRMISQSPRLRAVVVIPDILLKTETARNVLSPEVTRKEAVFNIAHTALLIDSFIKEEYEWLKEGMRDKLHQDKRASLIPGMPETLQSALEHGAYGSALSGSGPTLLALTPQEKESEVAAAMLTTLKEHGLPAEAHTLNIEPHGAVILNR